MLSRRVKAIIAVASLLCTAHADQMLIRHTTAQGGTQSRGQTTTDFVTHFCSNTAVPLALRACGADAFTGGNPSPRDAATPINVILQCRDGTETLLCSTAGNRIDQMCCEGVLPQGFAAAQCTPVVRVLNGGGSVATLVTGQIDVWEATSEDLNRMQHFNIRFTPPTLPRPPPDQVKPFLTSVASLTPITVPFNRYHTQLTDINFHYCGANSIVTFGVGGTSLAAETEVFVCEKGMDDCGHQTNHGTDGFVTVFHSIVSKTLEYGKEYFLRVYSYGHQDGNANITVAVANTVVQLPSKVTEGFSR